jgi:hypothetical protein
MAVITGKDGTVTLTSVDGASSGGISVNAWTLNISRDIVNISAFGDTDTMFPTNMGGQVSASGSVSGVATDAGAPFRPDALAGTSAGAITLTSVTGDDYTFNALITGGSVSVNRNGEATCSINFVSSGPITTPAS